MSSKHRFPPTDDQYKSDRKMDGLVDGNFWLLVLRNKGKCNNLVKSPKFILYSMGDSEEKEAPSSRSKE